MLQPAPTCSRVSERHIQLHMKKQENSKIVHSIDPVGSRGAPTCCVFCALNSLSPERLCIEFALSLQHARKNEGLAPWVCNNSGVVETPMDSAFQIGAGKGRIALHKYTIRTSKLPREVAANENAEEFDWPDKDWKTHGIQFHTRSDNFDSNDHHFLLGFLSITGMVCNIPLPQKAFPEGIQTVEKLDEFLNSKAMGGTGIGSYEPIFVGFKTFSVTQQSKVLEEARNWKNKEEALKVCANLLGEFPVTTFSDERKQRVVLEPRDDDKSTLSDQALGDYQKKVSFFVMGPPWGVVGASVLATAGVRGEGTSGEALPSLPPPPFARPIHVAGLEEPRCTGLWGWRRGACWAAGAGRGAGRGSCQWGCRGTRRRKRGSFKRS